MSDIRKSNRFRLNKEEIILIKQYRENQTIHESFLVGSELNATKISNRHRDLNKKYKNLLKEIDFLQDKVSILKYIPTTNDLKTSIKPRNSIKTSQSIAFAIASDWHIEEQFSGKVVNNINEFNPIIGKKRVNIFFERTLKLINMFRSNTKIDILILAILGDLMSGYIHEELEESNSSTPSETVVILTELIKNGINYLVEDGNFEKIIIPCCCGNHGRTTVKPRKSTGQKNNYEHIIYSMLNHIFRDDDRIEFKISEGYHLYLDVFDNYKLRFHHGDNISYMGGVGGITVPVEKAIKNWNENKRVNLDIFGHFHQLRHGNTWMCNGSLIGYNPYALSIKAVSERPQQGFFLVEKDHGKTIVAPIILE